MSSTYPESAPLVCRCHRGLSSEARRSTTTPVSMENASTLTRDTRRRWMARWSAVITLPSVHRYGVAWRVEHDMSPKLATSFGYQWVTNLNFSVLEPGRQVPVQYRVVLIIGALSYFSSHNQVSSVHIQTFHITSLSALEAVGWNRNYAWHPDQEH